MDERAHATVLNDLRQRIARIDGRRRRGRACLPFGHAGIDARLGGGLPLGALHEVAARTGDIAHAGAASLFVAGLVARLRGPVLWCVEQPDLFAPALAGVGLHPDRVLYVATGRARDVAAAMEEGARHAGLAAVVGELRQLDLTASRRLSLAAGASGTTVFALRLAPPRARGRANAPADGSVRASTDSSTDSSTGTSTCASTSAAGGADPPAAPAADPPSAALTRWRVGVAGSLPPRAGRAADPGLPGLGRPLWTVDLTRCRTAEPGGWIVGACDDKGLLAACEPPAGTRDGGDARGVG